MLPKRFLSSNMLKLIAVISMTIDHIGLILLDNFTPFRIIGRLAFPIFAYTIAEGTKYTKNKKRYFLNIFFLGALCQIIYFVFERSLYQNILITFSLSILLIYAFEKSKAKKIWLLPFFLMLVLSYFLSGMLPNIVKGFGIDYGFFGILLPFVISLSDDRQEKLNLTLLGLVVLSSAYGKIQWYSLLSIIPLLFYNGTRGNKKYKYLYYAYYPLHIGILYCIDYLCGVFQII